LLTVNGCKIALRRCVGLSTTGDRHRFIAHAAYQLLLLRKGSGNDGTEFGVYISALIARFAQP